MSTTQGTVCKVPALRRDDSREFYVTVIVAPGGNGERYLCRNGELRGACVCHDTDGWYATEAEATFRLLLYTDPARALAEFYKATGGEYVGTCGECEGSGWGPSPSAEEQYLGTKKQGRCPTCHGTGGPPSPEDMGEISDWFSEREMDIEASVLRSIVA